MGTTWETNNPQPEIGAFILGFFGQEYTDLFDRGEIPDPIIGFVACRRTMLLRIAKAYGIPTGDEGLFNGSTPKNDIVKIMDVMWGQGKFEGKPGNAGVDPAQEEGALKSIPIEDMPWAEMKALAASRGISTHRVKKPELIAALNG